jgi:RHS repeat-associated protein
MAEMEGGVMTRCFVRGAGIAEGTGDVIGEIIGTEESNAHPLFYFVNHRGDTMAAYVQHDTTKTLAAEYRYDAFGNVLSSTTNEPAFLPRFTFSTKEYLAEAGLYLYAYRVYDPVAGRWTQRDPIDYQDSANLYQFCGNDPVNGWDTDGRIFLELMNPFNWIPVAVKLVKESFNTEHSDKAKHAIVSKEMTIRFGPVPAFAIGVVNEEIDMVFGEGFNVQDVAANLKGIGSVFSLDVVDESDLAKLPWTSDDTLVGGHKSVAQKGQQLLDNADARKTPADQTTNATK